MKKIIALVTSGLAIAIVGSMSSPAAADNDDDMKPGGKGAITTYKDDKKTVVKVEACVKGKCFKDACMYNCMDAGKKADSFMRKDYCKGKKGQKWFFQAGNRNPIQNECR